MSRASVAVALAKKGDALSEAERGRLDAMLDRHLSVASPQQMQWWLYGRQGAPSRWASRIPVPCAFSAKFQREGRSLTDRTTQSVEALLALWRETMGWHCVEEDTGETTHCGFRNSLSRKTCAQCLQPRRNTPATPDPRLSATLRLLWLHALREKAACKVDRDGRIRTSVNLCGDADFSHMSYESNLDTGLAFHAIPDALKALVVASEGHTLGLVRWVEPRIHVAAAEMATLGDGAMLESLRRGTEDDHGILWHTIVGEQPSSISAQIARDTYADTGTPLYVEPAAVKAAQDVFHAAYPGIRQRQKWLHGKLARDGHLIAPGGARRKFFGRPYDRGTERDLCGFTPKAATTFAVERAWARFWSDGGTRVLYAGADFLLCERPEVLRTDCVDHYEDAPLTVAGQPLALPVRVTFGRTWADCL